MLEAALVAVGVAAELAVELAVEVAAKASDFAAVAVDSAGWADLAPASEVFFTAFVAFGNSSQRG
jgi:hypothetical protein